MAFRVLERLTLCAAVYALSFVSDTPAIWRAAAAVGILAAAHYELRPLLHWFDIQTERITGGRKTVGGMALEVLLYWIVIAATVWPTVWVMRRVVTALAAAVQAATPT